MKTRRTTSPALCAVIGLLFLSGCSSLSHNPDRPAALFLNTYGIEPPTTPRDFTTCYHYGCDGGGGEVHLSALEWQQVRNLFLPPATDAGEEREHIAVAIAMLEETIGRQNNTFADQACNNFRAPVESYQHDCVAETVNSTIYLLLMEGNQLLRWHQVSYPAHRPVAAILFPHYSAVIKEIASGELYVVDSWFYPNGERPIIVPLARWGKNYYPKPCR